MLSSFKNVPLQLFSKRSSAYTDEQKQFATTLHFYGPKAYEYCGKQLPLPAQAHCEDGCLQLILIQDFPFKYSHICKRKPAVVPIHGSTSHALLC